MIDKIKEHITDVKAFNATTKEEIENFRIKYLGKKGILNGFFAEFKNVPNEQKKDFVISNNVSSGTGYTSLQFGSVSDIYLFDMVTGSWVFGDSLLSDGKAKTNFEVDWNNDLIWSYTVDT